MHEWFFLPAQASTFAQEYDRVFVYLTVLTSVLTGIVLAIIIVAAVKYRRRDPDEIPQPVAGSLKLELYAAAGIFLVFMTAFVPGTLIYFRQYAVPPTATFDVHVVGKQWMWLFQHPTGRREINELHVPVNTQVRLTMASEDVIHSLFFPAFRLKSDVIPGRYLQMWVEATTEGTFPIYCAEYCGLKHSGMLGQVVVMNETDYQNWAAGQTSQVSPQAAGQAKFQELGCASCHQAGAAAPQCPPLQGLSGRTVALEGGGSVLADDAYLRESILTPQAKIVRGYPPLMPPFQGVVTEVELSQLLAYVKSLGGTQ